MRDYVSPSIRLSAHRAFVWCMHRPVMTIKQTPLYRSITFKAEFGTTGKVGQLISFSTRLNWLERQGWHETVISYTQFHTHSLTHGTFFQVQITTFLMSHLVTLCSFARTDHSAHLLHSASLVHFPMLALLTRSIHGLAHSLRSLPLHHELLFTLKTWLTGLNYRVCCLY